MQPSESFPVSPPSLAQSNSTQSVSTEWQATVSDRPSSPATPASAAVAHDAALLLIPICFVAIWAAVVCVISDTWKLSRKDMSNSKQLAQLPCKKCRFFSNNPYMKCAVNPYVAMTKAAMECQDFCPRDRRAASYSNRK